MLTASERLDRLRLFRTANVGPITYHQLLARYRSAADALEALPELSRRGGRQHPIKPYSRAAATEELRRLERLGGTLIVHGEPAYPPALASIDDAPPVLMARGHANLLTRPCVATVGARNASLNGRNLSRRLAMELGELGYVVVSGLARGIDASAHEGALATGTIAVLAGGVDVVYPPENNDLYDAIVEQGAVVTEMPPGTEPQARHFPRRNRIISGLSLGTVVIEAAPRSGSLITARLALEQGREVFAVPGSPLDPRCGGPNRLIREGATLTECGEDVHKVLEPMLRAPAREPGGQVFRAPPPTTPTEMELAEARRTVGDCLSPAPVAVDEIVRQCQLSPAVVQMVLLELELAGRVEREPGGRVVAV